MEEEVRQAPIVKKAPVEKQESIRKAGAGVILVTIQKWCADKSASDKRVELIGGFYHYVEGVLKLPKATREKYDSLFAVYVKTPAGTVTPKMMARNHR